jgi:hypothetical protein
MHALPKRHPCIATPILAMHVHCHPIFRRESGASQFGAIDILNILGTQFMQLHQIARFGLARRKTRYGENFAYSIYFD